jgi:hypothetical protein
MPFNPITNLLAVTQATEATTAMSRRSFLAGLGGLTALSLIGCGTSPETGPDAHGGTGVPDAGGGVGVPTALGVERDSSDNPLKIVNLPWAFPSHVGYYTDRILGVGTDQSGVPNQVFEFSPASAERPIPWSTRYAVGGTRRLNYLARREDGDRYALTTDEGFYELLLGSSPNQNFVPFPAAPVGALNFGGGAVYSGNNKLLVALSNGTVGSDGTTVTFGDQGTLLVYDLNSGGTAGSRRVRPSGGRNPTGLAMIPGTSTLLILNSGPVLNESPQSSLVLFDTNSETVIDTIPFPSTFRAQLSGNIAVSDDGRTVVIGSSQGSDVLFVDLQTRSVRARAAVPGTSFHPSIRIDSSRGVAYVSDFSGVVGMMDLAARTLIASQNLGSGGPSALAGSDLIQLIMNGAMRLYPV